MKTKNTTVFLTVMALVCAMNIQSATISVNNGADDGVVAPPHQWQFGKALFATSAKSGTANLQPPRVALGENGVYISSECALTSPYLAQSRTMLMAGLAGADVQTDRVITPAAWYRVPTTWGPNYGLQWFDSAVTTSLSFMGAPAPTNGVAKDEHGHRIIISLTGKGNPNGYYVRVSTSLTNFAPAFFAISTNSSDNTPLQFSFTFVGISYGQNGVLESAWNPQVGKWIAGGDDIVYDGSQGVVYPHQVTVDLFQRFGSSVSLNSATPYDFGGVMDQFATMPLAWLKAELVTNGVTVASEKVVAAQPSLDISRISSMMSRLVVIGGQYNFPYTIESAANLTGAPWVQLVGQTLFLGTQGQFDITNNQPEYYFRLKTTRTASAPPGDL